MILKDYLKHCCLYIPIDSEEPADIVQMLACLIGSRLSTLGKLPVSCGVGEQLDMDIVQAGILAGLEKVSEYDASQGTSLRQFLYPIIAGNMRNYAWERENRVSDSRPADLPVTLPIDEGKDDIDTFDDNGQAIEAITVLIDPATPETVVEKEQASSASYQAIRAAVKGLGSEDMGMLLRDAQIGYNRAKRLAWAEEIGVSLGALQVKLSRLRRDAREWALTVQ